MKTIYQVKGKQFTTLNDAINYANRVIWFDEECKIFEYKKYSIGVDYRHDLYKCVNSFVCKYEKLEFVCIVL